MKNAVKKIFYATMFGLLFANAAFAQLDLEAIFKDANKAYENKTYQKAIKQYQKLVDRNVQSAPLFYNLGSCYFQLDDVANSIYFLEKAKKLNPNDVAVNNNLGLARANQKDDIDKFPEFLLFALTKKAANFLSSNLWFYLTVLFFTISLLCFWFISKLKFINYHNINGFYVWTIFLLLGLFTLLLSNIKYNNDFGSESAILFEKETTVLEAPNKNAEEIITIHEGLKFKIIDAVDTWIKIELSDGTKGWLIKNGVKVI